MNNIKTVSVMQLAFSLFVLFGLNACRDQSVEQNVVESSDTKPITTGQLKVLAELKFTSHSSMDLAVDINKQGGGPAYLSVYSKYSLADNQHWEINYDSRLLASYMVNSQAQQKIAIPQHLTHLLVQVWFYDDRAPVSKEIRIDKQLSIQL